MEHFTLSHLIHSLAFFLIFHFRCDPSVALVSLTLKDGGRMFLDSHHVKTANDIGSALLRLTMKHIDENLRSVTLMSVISRGDFGQI
jgi:hypothetical protein